MFRLLTSIIITFILVVFTNISNAQVSLIPSHITEVVTTTSHFRMNMPFVVTDASNPSARRYASRAVQISKPRIGQLAKARMFTPWGLALQAAMVGAGYYLDQTNDQVLESDPADFNFTYPEGGVRITFASGWSGTNCTSGGVGINTHASLGHALTHIIDNCDGPGNSETATYIFNGNTQCYQSPTRMIWRDTCSNIATSRFQIDSIDILDEVFPPHETTTIDQTVVDTIVTETDNPTPPELTDQQVADAIAQNTYNRELTEQLISNPQTNQTVDVNIAEVAAVIADLIADLNALDDSDPLTVPTTDGDLDTGTLTVTSVEPSQQVNPVPQTQTLTTLIENNTTTETTTEIDPCSANPNTLMCLDATGDFTEETLTEAQIPFDITPISLASNSSCPSNEVLNLSLGTYEFDHQFVCARLIEVRPIIVSLFSIMALFVIGGIKV